MMSDMTWLFDRSKQQGRLELTDRDRLDLIHRMSTNDVKDLPVSMGASTVLTTALARIIDRVIIYNRGNSALMLTNRPDVIRGWLQKHIFFQDKIKIRDVSAEWGQLEIYGPNATSITEQIAPGAGKLALHGFIDSAGVIVAKTYPLAEEGYIILAAPDTLKTLRETSLSPLAVGDEAKYEQLRIAAGMPGPEHELTEAYIPLEANLWDSVSFHKGCYIGQEIIARMESRGKLAKTLVCLRLSAKVDSGATLISNDRSVGTITSVTMLDDGSIVALGFVKPEFADPGVQLMISETAVVAEVIPAPLIQPRSQENEA